MRYRYILLFSLTICTQLILAQSKSYNRYEPSKKNPFGLPNPDAPAQIKDFAPMIGKCDCKSQARNQDQTWADPIDMVWTFKYIMNGMGVQDETIKSDGSHSGSIRQYHADSARWYVHYYSSATPVSTLSSWEGNLSPEKNKIALYRPSKAPNGMDGFYRLTFSDFTDKGYNWVGEWVNGDETIVFPTWKIECKRRKEKE